MAKLAVGIDIGSFNTKVVQIEQKVTLHLLKAAVFRTPYLPSGENASLKYIDVNAFWNQIITHIPLPKLQASRVTVNIPSSSATIMTVLMPKIGKVELANAAIAEARRKMIPTSGPNHVFVPLLLGEKIVAKIPRFEVLVIRVEKNDIDKVLDLFKGLDFSPSLITLSSYTVLDILPKDAWIKGQDIVFIDLGATSINISVAKEGKLHFMRNVAYGFRDIINDISVQLGISMEKVDKLIKEEGVPEVSFDIKNKVAAAEEIMRQKMEADSAGGQKTEYNALELKMLWQSHIEKVVLEIRRSLAFYKEQEEGPKRTEYIYFYGEGIQIKNLFNVLTSQLGGKLQIISPFKSLQIPQEKEFADNSNPIFVNAASLALAALAKEKKQATVNFLPIQLKKKEVAAARQLALMTVGMIFLCIFAMASINAFIIYYSHIISTNIVNFQLNTGKRVGDKLKVLIQREEKTRKQASLIAGIMKQRKDLSLPLRELTRLIPPKMLLTRLLITQTSFLLGGEIGKSGSEGDRVQAAQSNKSDSGTSPGSGRYYIGIEAQVDDTYEQAAKVRNRFIGNLESSEYFFDISATPLELERVSAQGATEAQDITEPKVRKFAVKISLNKE